jgi:hypothetical protein
MDFRQARSEYLHLRHAYRSGQISSEEFEKRVNAMIIHSKDQTWMIGVKTGKWYRREGKNWVEDPPPAESVQAASAPAAAASSAVRAAAARSTTPPRQSVPPAGNAKPAPTVETKLSRPLITWLVVLLIAIVLVVAALGGLMAAKVIETPAFLSGLFSGEKQDGIGAESSDLVVNKLADALTPLADSGVSIPGQLSLSGFLLTDDISGEWKLREASYETLTIEKDGSIRVYSEVEGYDYAGVYSFVDDSTIHFFLGDSWAESSVWIDAGVLTLQINGQPLVYDKAE